MRNNLNKNIKQSRNIGNHRFYKDGMSFAAICTYDSGNSYFDYLSINIDLFFIVGVAIPGIV